jgi:hypothetical protein
LGVPQQALLDPANFGPARPAKPTEAQIAERKVREEIQDVEFKHARSVYLEKLLSYDLRSDIHTALVVFKQFIDSHDVPASERISSRPHSSSGAPPQELQPVRLLTSQGLRAQLSEVLGELLILGLATPEVIDLYKIGSHLVQFPQRKKAECPDSISRSINATPDDKSPQSLALLEPAFEWTADGRNLKMKEVPEGCDLKMWGSRLLISEPSCSAGPTKAMEMIRIRSKIEYLLPAYRGLVADKLTAIKQQLETTLRAEHSL